MTETGSGCSLGPDVSGYLCECGMDFYSHGEAITVEKCRDYWLARASAAEKQRDAWREDAERLADALRDYGTACTEAGTPDPRTTSGKALLAHEKLLKEAKG